ncbi:MAG TPA: hypothetical protein VF525_02385 [Pyrinomonadaceae bacterium]|jgi:hypothetical protein
MNIGRFILLCLLSLTYVSAAQAQGAGKCTMTLAQLPAAAELYGFRPGMSLGEVRTRFPQLRVAPADEFGVTKTSVNPTFDPTLDKTNLQGVRTLAFDFLDGRLYTLSIGYNGEFKWQTLEDFLPGIDKALGLPAAWEKRSWRGQQMDCADFQLTARLIAQSPSLVIVDETARAALNKRIAEKADQEPQQF